MCYINLGAVLGGPVRGLCLSGDLRPRRHIYGTGMERVGGGDLRNGKRNISLWDNLKINKHHLDKKEGGKKRKENRLITSWRNFGVDGSKTE